MADTNPTPLNPATAVSWRSTKMFRLLWAGDSADPATKTPPESAIDLGCAELQNPEAIIGDTLPRFSGGMQFYGFSEALVFRFCFSGRSNADELRRKLSEFWQSNTPQEGLILESYGQPKTVTLFAQNEQIKEIGGQFAESRIRAGMTGRFIPTAIEVQWYQDDDGVIKMQEVELKLAPASEVAFYKLDGPLIRSV